MVTCRASVIVAINKQLVHHTICFSVGMIFTFVTNARMSDGIFDVEDEINDNLADIVTYIDTTVNVSALMSVYMCGTVTSLAKGTQRRIVILLVDLLHNNCLTTMMLQNGFSVIMYLRHHDFANKIHIAIKHGTKVPCHIKITVCF